MRDFLALEIGELLIRRARLDDNDQVVVTGGGEVLQAASANISTTKPIEMAIHT